MNKQLKELIASGLTESSIVDLIEKNGVKTTQPSISRLKNGITKSTNYALGAAIVSLHARICAKKGRKKRA